MVKVSSTLLAGIACLAASTTSQAAWIPPTITDAWSDYVLAVHNGARARYGAGPLTWNANLYPSAFNHARQCRFQHSNGQGRVRILFPPDGRLPFYDYDNHR